MKVDLHRCGPMCFGACEIVKTAGGGVSFSRMTPELARFYSYAEGAVIRASCPTNVRLRFMTDSGRIGLKMRFGPAARTIYCLEVAVKGHGACRYFQDTADHVADVAFTLPGEGLREVTVAMPHLAECVLEEMELEDGAAFEKAPPFARKIVAVGDSILQGMTSSCCTRSIFGLLGEMLEADVHNVAVGGAVMGWEPVAASAALGGNAVVVGFGVNDYIQETEMGLFRERAMECMRVLASNAARKSVVVTPIPYPGGRQRTSTGHSMEDYRDAIREAVALFPETTLLDGPEFFPDDRRYYIDDCHPNDSGARIYAEALAAVLAERLGLGKTVAHL